MLRLNENTALAALSRYNRTAVIDLDHRARELFSGGLGPDLADVQRQVEFVLDSYGGMSAPVPRGCASTIARMIVDHCDLWSMQLAAAPAYRFSSVDFRFAVPNIRLFECFGPVRTKDNAAEIRCLTKFLHLLKPESFVIVDRWIGAALGVDIGRDSSTASYASFASRFLEFIDMHRALIPALQAHDRPKSWSDIKLFDKILLCRRAAEMRRAA
jgi:hypothetical protein